MTISPVGHHSPLSINPVRLAKFAVITALVVGVLSNLQSAQAWTTVTDACIKACHDQFSGKQLAECIAICASAMGPC